eukprot:UN30410
MTRKNAASTQAAKGMVVNVCIDAINLELKRGFGVDTKASSTNLLTLGMKSFVIGLNMPPNAPMLLDVQMENLVIWDSSEDTTRRGVKSDFRKLISFSTFNKNSAVVPLKVKLESDEKHTDITVTMTGLDLTLQGVLWTALDFLFWRRNLLILKVKKPQQ